MAEAKKGRGCFFNGCITVVILLIIGVVVAYFGGRYALTKLVDTYTAPAPKTFAPLAATPEERKSIRTKAEDFQKSMAKPGESGTLTLTADELNVLVEELPSTTQYKNQVRFQIVSNTVLGDMSIPLEQLGMSQLRGRYMNGIAAFDVAQTNGRLQLQIKSVTVNGQPLPASFVANLQGANFLEGAYKNPDSAKALERIDSVEVKDDKIVIQVKP